MKKTTCLFAITALVAGLAIASCKKNDADGGCVTAQINTRADALGAAINAWAASPTKANCEAYKTAANDWLDYVDGCPGITQTEINSTRDAIKDLDCQ